MYRFAWFLGLVLIFPVVESGSDEYVVQDGEGDVTASYEPVSIDIAKVSPEIDFTAVQLRRTHEALFVHLPMMNLSTSTFGKQVAVYALTWKDTAGFVILQAISMSEHDWFFSMSRHGDDLTYHNVRGLIESDSILLTISAENVTFPMKNIKAGSLLEAQVGSETLGGGPVWLRDRVPNEGSFDFE